MLHARKHIYLRTSVGTRYGEAEWEIVANMLFVYRKQQVGIWNLLELSATHLQAKGPNRPRTEGQWVQRGGKRNS